MNTAEIDRMAEEVAQKITRDAILCGSYGYEFSSHIGKAMRELHLLEAHEIGFPSGAIFTAERAGRELGYCTGTPISERDKITAKLYLAQERVAQSKYSLARLAVEEANDIMARELALAKGRIEI